MQVMSDCLNMEDHAAQHASCKPSMAAEGLELEPRAATQFHEKAVLQQGHPSPLFLFLFMHD